MGYMVYIIGSKSGRGFGSALTAERYASYLEEQGFEVIVTRL